MPQYLGPQPRCLDISQPGSTNPAGLMRWGAINKREPIRVCMMVLASKENICKGAIRLEVTAKGLDTAESPNSPPSACLWAPRFLQSWLNLVAQASSRKQWRILRFALSDHSVCSWKEIRESWDCPFYRQRVLKLHLPLVWRAGRDLLWTTMESQMCTIWDTCLEVEKE